MQEESMNLNAVIVRILGIVVLCLGLTSCNFSLANIEDSGKNSCFFKDFSYNPPDFPKATIVEIADKTGQDWKQNICSCLPCPKTVDIILVDKTVRFSHSFSSTVSSIISGYINYGDVAEVINFSSYKGHYTQVKSEVFFEPRIDDIEDCIKMKYYYYIKRNHTERFREQKEQFKKILFQDILKNNPLIPKTQIILTLNEIADTIKDIKNTCPKSEIKLILVSDMLENGDIISFYSKGHIYIPSSYKNLIMLLKRKNLIPNLKDVDVYILGLGYYHDRTISEEQLLRLKRFWKAFFREAKANIKGIGTPILP